MPKKLDRRVVLRIYLLRQAGRSLSQIMEVLNKEFEEELIPNGPQFQETSGVFQRGTTQPNFWRTCHSGGVP